MLWPRHAGWWLAIAASSVVTGIALVLSEALVADAAVLFLAAALLWVVYRAEVVSPRRIDRRREGQKRRWYLGAAATWWIPAVLLIHLTVGVWPFPDRSLQWDAYISSG